VQIGTRRQLLLFRLCFAPHGVRRCCTAPTLTSTEVDPWRCPPVPVASAHPQQPAATWQLDRSRWHRRRADRSTDVTYPGMCGQDVRSGDLMPSGSFSLLSLYEDAFT